MPVLVRPGICPVRPLIFWLALTFGTALCAEQTEGGAEVAALLRKAQAGDVAAQLEVTEHFLVNSTADTADAPARDFQQVEKWLQAAALKGSAPAARMLGVLLISDYPGVPVNRARAFAAFQKAAQGGDSEAIVEMGHLHANGTGTPQDFAKAEEWWQKALATAPDGSPEHDRITWLLEGLAEKREVAAEKSALAAKVAAPAAIAAVAVAPAAPVVKSASGNTAPAPAVPARRTPAELLAAAQKGDAEAMYQQGLAELERRRVWSDKLNGVIPVDRQRDANDFRWIMDAARAGHPEAQFLAATHWLSAETAAAKTAWLEKAAAQGHTTAKEKLAALAKGTAAANAAGAFDQIKALRAEERARLTEAEWTAAERQRVTADQYMKLLGTDATLQLTVGCRYRDGAGGFVQDYGRAFHWFSRAAKNGSADAETELGNIAFNGLGRPVDKPAAFQHYLRAAELGSVTGQLNAGYCYSSGEGVPRDLLRGYDWTKKAADQGQPEAKELLAKLSRNAGLQVVLAERNRLLAQQALQQGVAGALATAPAAQPATPPAAPVVDGRVTDLNPATFAALQRIKKANAGSLTEANAQELKKAIRGGDGQVDDAERDLLTEMTQSQFRNIRVRSAGAAADAPEVMVFPVVGRAKEVLRGILQSKPEFEEEWNRGAVGYGAICAYAKQSPGSEAEALRFISGKLADEWARSNLGNNYKPLRDLVGRLYGYSNSPGNDTSTGRDLLHKAMAQIDLNSGGQVPDFLYNWVRAGAAN